MKPSTRSIFLLASAILFAFLAAPARAADDAHAKQADAAAAKAIAYLRSTQGVDGSWSPKAGPAVTALIVRALLERSDIKQDDPAVTKAIEFILSKAKRDGSIHDGMLENYNTAISIAALARVNDPKHAETIKKGQDYLRNLQWSGQPDPHGKTIDESHPFYGGAGYGKDGRPDMSNTQIMLEGLRDSGLDCKDPAFVRAIAFITKCQGTPANKTYGDKIVNDGGFIYATSQSKDKIGVLESKAGEVKMEDGTTRMATYGSITYAGFKSYLYAELDRNDPRVVDAFGWITRHYTLDQNPGMPEPQKLQGLYYYYHTFARAFHAWGSKEIKTADGKTQVWSNDLIAKLVSLQKEDGSWSNSADRWMEGDPNLVTAYSLIALEYATK